MKNFVWLVPLFLGLNMVLAGCDDRSRQSAAPTSPAAPSAVKMSDSDLEKAVRAQLDSVAELRNAKLDVDADADKNEITLSGTVPSQELRTKAIEVAKGAHSGLVVNDKIDVKPAA